MIIAATDKAGNVTTVTVNAGHHYGTEWESDRNGHWQECAVCGDTSEVLAHAEDSGTVTKPATETETGIRTYKCSVCGYVMRTEEIEKLPPSDTGGSGSAGSDSSVSDSSGSTGAAPGQPFLKDSSGREGWDVVRAEAEKAAAAPAGGTVAVDMNGAASVPGSIFEAVRGKDVTLSFDMGGGITWSVNGKDVTTETAGSTDFSVKAGVGAIPAGLVEETAAGLAHMELSLAHEGAFGFTATLTVRIISSGGGITAGSSGTAAGYTGMYANLFYYNPGRNILEFICAGRVGEDGTVDLPFVHASDYTLILSASPMGAMQEPAAQARVKSVKLSKTLYTYDGKAKKPSVVAVDTEGRRISGKYYTVSYQNNKKVGKAAVTIKFKGGYSGAVKKTFTIRPAGTSIQKLAASSGGFTVKWKKKTAQTSGYQIQYSANAKFKGSSTRSVLVRKNSQVQKTVKNLKAQTKYYVRIRTYKTVKVNGKNTRIYSAWSKAVTVKTLPAAPENKTAASVRGAEFLIVEKEDGKR